MFADELNPPEPEPIDFRSVTMKDFNKPEFISKKPVPTKVKNRLSSSHKIFDRIMICDVLYV